MLHLYTPHHCGGAEMAVHGLLRALAGRGHTVDVVLSQIHPGVTKSYDVDGVSVHPRMDKADPTRWMADPARRPHFVLTHLENTDRATILGRIYRIPVVQVMHNTYGPTRRALTRGPALVVANSAWLAEDAAGWWSDEMAGHVMPPVVVIPPPIDVEEYRTTPGAHITLINVIESKGADVFYALADRFPRQKFLGVAGAYGHQDRRDRPNVAWLDHMPGDRMRDQVYRRTRVLLMPSEYESYGRVGIEAACSGIPTIAHPTAGLRESLGDAAAFADRADLGKWAGHIRRLLKPAAWSAASARASALAAGLDTAGDLTRWATTVEAMTGELARHA